MTETMPLLAITPGEPAGIGPEILLRFHQEHPEFRVLAVADPGLLEETAEAIGSKASIHTWQPGDEAPAGILHCLPVQRSAPSRPGQLEPANAAYVLETLKQATKIVQQGHAAALVTGPVHKGVINDAGVPFSGHTEFLAKLAGVPRVVMMLTAPGLRVALVTTHLPLRSVPGALTPQRLEDVLRITERELRRRFGIARPRIQVLGLNPHAGEGGHLGSEDDEIIRPVLEILRRAGFVLDGPVPADSAFTPPRLARCDAVVAMYHDQGLPVLKHMGFGRSVNVTLGLPYVRTSVDHGTALDIAGKGLAEAGSMYQAADAARRMALAERNAHDATPGA